MATVLVVDEQVWSRQALCCALEQSGYHTEQAADLAEVRQRLRQIGPGWRPDLTFVELVRERSNGFSLAAWLQAHNHGVVVLLSERDDEADRLWAQSRGINHTWSRGQGVDSLCALVRSILTESGGDQLVGPQHRRLTGSLS